MTRQAQHPTAVFRLKVLARMVWVGDAPPGTFHISCIAGTSIPGFVWLTYECMACMSRRQIQFSYVAENLHKTPA